MRAKTSIVRHQKHKKVLNRTKGMRMTRNRLYKVSREADLHAGQYAFAGRKLRKRNMRRLWILRINARLRQFDLKYSRFIKLLKAKKIDLDRKILAELTVNEAAVFAQIVKKVTKED